MKSGLLYGLPKRWPRVTKFIKKKYLDKLKKIRTAFNL